MNDVTFEATVINGQIQLPGDIHLPENTRVVVILPTDNPAPFQMASPRLRDPSRADLFRMDVREA